MLHNITKRFFFFLILLPSLQASEIIKQRPWDTIEQQWKDCLADKDNHDLFIYRIFGQLQQSKDPREVAGSVNLINVFSKRNIISFSLENKVKLGDLLFKDASDSVVINSFLNLLESGEVAHMPLIVRQKVSELCMKNLVLKNQREKLFKEKSTRDFQTMISHKDKSFDDIFNAFLKIQNFHEKTFAGQLFLGLS